MPQFFCRPLPTAIVVAAVASFGIVPCALAGQSGSEATSFQYLLTDLAPADGITPSLNGDVSTWHGSTTPETMPRFTYWWDLDEWKDLIGNEWHTPSGAFGSTTVPGVDGYYESVAGIGMSSNGQPITAGVEITPHTEITLQLDYRFTSDGAGNAGANGGFGAYEYLYAICPSEGTWAGCFSDDRLAEDGWMGPGTRQETGTLTLSYFNDSDEYERLLYGADLHTDGGISVAPVPEPASLSLFSLGLGLIGLGTMRRRKDKREA